MGSQGLLKQIGAAVHIADRHNSGRRLNSLLHHQVLNALL
jgi:hypothetical protein